jgi:hypothetical protein
MPRQYTRKVPSSLTERAPPQDVKARERDLQVDTRTEAQKWLGEPPFHRSALGKKLASGN